MMQPMQKTGSDVLWMCITFIPMGLDAILDAHQIQNAHAQRL